MKRLKDWRTRLDAAVEAARARPFDPDAFHCAFFAADMVAAMTGEDPAAEFRGLSRMEAVRLLKAKGFDDVPAYVGTILPDTRPSRAAPGDIAAVDAEDGTRALGLVTGADILVPTGGRGLGFVPLSEARLAWRVS